LKTKTLKLIDFRTLLRCLQHLLVAGKYRIFQHTSIDQKQFNTDYT